MPAKQKLLRTHMSAISTLLSASLYFSNVLVLFSSPDGLAQEWFANVLGENPFMNQQRDQNLSKEPEGAH